MRTVITGGAGFVGSHLAEYLLEKGQEVVVLDDMSTGRVDNLQTILGTPRLRVVRGSICDPSVVNECLAGSDTVFHLAAAVGTFTIRDKPMESLRTNVYGTETVLEAAYRQGARILVASTSEIYGMNTKIGLTEDDLRIMGSPLRSRWSYADAKALDEMLTQAYVVAHGLRAVIVRLFNTVGPRQSGRYGMVIPRFVAQALAGVPLTVYGTGQQIRCFCHILDVVPALVALLEDKNAHGKVFNLGSPEQITIQSLAKRVVAATGCSSDIVYVSYERAHYPGYEDVSCRVPECTRVRDQIGFVPSRSLDDIIRDVVEHQLAGCTADSISLAPDRTASDSR